MTGWGLLLPLTTRMSRFFGRSLNYCVIGRDENQGYWSSSYRAEFRDKAQVILQTVQQLKALQSDSDDPAGEKTAIQQALREHLDYVLNTVKPRLFEKRIREAVESARPTTEAEAQRQAEIATRNDALQARTADLESKLSRRDDRSPCHRPVRDRPAPLRRASRVTPVPRSPAPRSEGTQQSGRALDVLSLRRLRAEPSTRDVVAQTLAQAVFESGDTGFVDSSNDQITLIERVIGPAVQRASQ